MSHKSSRREAGPNQSSLGRLDAAVPLAWVTGAVQIDAALSVAQRQIVFIDGAVPDAQLLAAGVKPGVTAVVLDPHGDELRQIADYLASHAETNLAAIDVVAHGSDGALRLGNAVLDSATIPQYATDLAAIGAALRPGGAVQLYGCDVAQDASGVAFLQQLSAATGGAAIAAASHLVGAAAGGGSWALNVEVGSDTATNPFTASTQASYPGELFSNLTSNQIIFAAWNGLDNAPADSGNRVEQFGVSGSSAVSGSSIDLADGSQSNDSGLDYVSSGIAADTALNEYFVAVDNPATGKLTIQEGSLTGGGGLTTFWTDPLPDYDAYNGSIPVVALLGGLAIDAQGKELYFTQSAEDVNGNPVAADTGIFKVPLTGGTPTLVNVTSANLTEPAYLVLDTRDNLAFFDDAILASGGFPSVENLDEVNLSTGAVTVMRPFFNTGDSYDILQGLAINTADNTLYLTTANYGTHTASGNSILSIPFTVTGSGSSALASLGSTTTLYSGAGAAQSSDIVIDPAHNIFYTTGEQFVQAGTDYGGVFEGSLSGGLALTEVLSMTSLVGAGPATDTNLPQLLLLTQPVLGVGGTVTADSGGSAVVLDSGATVSVTDGQLIASATVTISDYFNGDTLTLGNLNGLTASFSGGILTLSGTGSTSLYQTELDAVKFVTTSTNVSPRTIDWTVSDGIVASATGTSTADVRVAPTVSASGTVTFTGGGAAVTRDPGLSVTAPASPTLASATVTISGYVSGDTLTVGTPGGLSTSFSGGTLTLSGSASLSTYANALDSITYSFSPGNGDPTGGGSHTSRTIVWQVNDGVLASGNANSTLDVVHAPPTLSAGATVNDVVGGPAVVLDGGLSVSDPDSLGLLQSATVSVGSGFSAGDTLGFANQNGISGSYNSATGVLSLSGVASIANYAAALESITFSAPGATLGARTIDWTASDGVASSTAVASTVTVHAVPTVTAGATVTFTGGGPSVTLDGGLGVTDPSSATLSSATVTIGAGYRSGDVLNVGTLGGLNVSYNNGVLTLTGGGSLATYQTALDSISYSFSPGNGDPTAGDTDTSRTISWVVNDGVAASGTATSTLDTVHAAPTVTAGASVAFNTGDPPVTLDGGLAVSDPDSNGLLASATVSIGSGLLAGDTLHFANTANITGSYDAGTGVLTLTGTDSIADYRTALDSVTYSFAGDPGQGGTDPGRTIDWTVSDGVAFSATATSALATLCFCAGTRIATPDGEVAVEALRPGDWVRLADGGAAPVRWVGHHDVARRFSDPLRDWPIRVRAGALGEQVPSRDLLLSPGHALRVGEVLAQASALVNGDSIVREPAVPEVFAYWHVELDRHALLLAEAAAAESFLDSYQELAFDNRAERPAPPEDAGELPYPRCKSPRQLPREVRATLAARAARLRPAVRAA
jgi:hypothetical protein